MRYRVLACDYDGTTAADGRVSPRTVAALQRLLATGRKLILVTGRELPELLAIFPEIALFESVVAENGALLYRPSNRAEKLLAEPSPPAFVQLLETRGVAPLSVGRAIVATWQPHEQAVLDTIRDLGLELQVIFNKGAVMVLPAGVNKATGLLAALKELSLSPHETVGVGDAENDHAFLALCECAAAVANALPSLRERADVITRGDHGNGVAELIEHMIANDLNEFSSRLTRHDLVLGTDDEGSDVTIPAYGPGVLIAGPSGSGKSTTTTSLLERLVDRRYQFCVIDPEGDYESLDFAIAVGTGQRGPDVEEVLQVLAQPDQNVVVNLIGLRLADRPAFFVKLLPKLVELRGRLARPHWLIVDEAHHLLPKSWEPMELTLAADLNRTALITVHPQEVHPAVLAAVGTVIAVGKAPQETIQRFCRTQQEETPRIAATELEPGQVMVWQRYSEKPPQRVQVAPSRSERRRHIRKYAEGELPPERSFFFQGPQERLNLRAQNVMLFLQIGDGVDDETWLYHLHDGGYSQWFRECIKDEELAAEAHAIELQRDLTAAESRALIRDAIERRYTLPDRAP